MVVDRHVESSKFIGKHLEARVVGTDGHRALNKNIVLLVEVDDASLSFVAEEVSDVCPDSSSNGGRIEHHDEKVGWEGGVKPATDKGIEANPLRIKEVRFLGLQVIYQSVLGKGAD